MSNRHPKGLYLLFTVEMWERFSYYGMRAILIFYLTKSYLEGGLAFDVKTANLIYGVFTGLVYLTPVIGGWIADRFIGQRRSITWGALIMAAGEFILAAGAAERDFWRVSPCSSSATAFSNRISRSSWANSTTETTDDAMPPSPSSTWALT